MTMSGNKSYISNGGETSQKPVSPQEQVKNLFVRYDNEEIDKAALTEALKQYVLIDSNNIPWLPDGKVTGIASRMENGK
jgi:hypothetical protein